MIVKTDGSFAALVVTVHTGAVFAEAGGGVPCSQLLSSYSLLFKPQTRSSSGTQEAGDGAQLLLRYCVCPLQSPSAVPAAGQC